MTPDAPTPEAKLQALFAADRPPARDLAFQARVAERIARRRLAAASLTVGLWAAVAALVLWLVRPMFGPLSWALGQTAAAAGPVLALALVSLAGGLWMATRAAPRRP